MNKNNIKQLINNYKKVYGNDDYIRELEDHLINIGHLPNIEHICEVCNSYTAKFGFDEGLAGVIDLYDLDIDPETLFITKLKNNENEGLKIEDLLKYLQPGYVAMDSNNKWFWFKYKPHTGCGLWMRNEIEHPWCNLSCLNIEPVDDWTKSLIKIGDKHD